MSEIEREYQLFKLLTRHINDGSVSTNMNWTQVHEIDDFYLWHLTNELWELFKALWNEPEGICHNCGETEYEVMNHECTECFHNGE